jgi:25S rRNA (adenine2142-N1)-methyltransferase
VLVDWIRDAEVKRGERKLRLLEVGALRVDNACSRSGLFEVHRTDLRSREQGIKEEDFMEREIPTSDDKRFDILSLSLVLNFVPDAEGRGNMLKRTTRFLRDVETHVDTKEEFENLSPCLFLVLPAPCVTNSRYMDDQRLKDLMNGLGYSSAKRKMTTKLVYTLWTWNPRDLDPVAEFKKVELRSGKSRNNFAIVLRKEESQLRA